MKRLLVLVPLAVAAIWVSVALATPASGTKSTIMSIGTLNGDVAYNTWPARDGQRPDLGY